VAYDATKLKEWQIAELAEEKMPTPDEWREKLKLEKNEIIPYGRICKLDFLNIMERLKYKPTVKHRGTAYATPLVNERARRHLPYGRYGQTRKERRWKFTTIRAGGPT
jgi:hypothetical protein